MATSLAKQCDVCAEDYDEEGRCPRRLHCFHTFCTQCISQLLSIRNSRCPFCQQRFDAQAAVDFDINTDALDLVKKAEEQKKNTASPEEVPLSPSEARRLEELKRKVAQKAMNTMNSYRDAKAEIDARIQRNNELKENLLRARTVLQEDIMARMNNLMESNLRIADYLDEEQTVLKEQLTVVQEQKKKYERGENTEEDDLVTRACLARLQGLISTDEAMRERVTEILRSRQNLVANVERILSSARDEDDDDIRNEHLDRNVLRIIEEIQAELGRGQ